MKKLLIILFILSFSHLLFSQNLDLIVTKDSSSIACRIDSITDTKIYFEMISHKKWIHTHLYLSKVADYKRNVINKDKFTFKRGTSYIELEKINCSELNLQRATQEELDICLNKALKRKKSGKTLTIVGSSMGAVGLIAAFSGGDLGVLAVGALTTITGGVMMAVGIPMNISGKKRVERINTIKNTVYDGITIDLKPCVQYNCYTQNYQHGVTLSMRF